MSEELDRNWYKHYIVLILIILEVLYESYNSIISNVVQLSLNPYYTGSTLWVHEQGTNSNVIAGLNPYYTGSTLWELSL